MSNSTHSSVHASSFARTNKPSRSLVMHIACAVFALAALLTETFLLNRTTYVFYANHFGWIREVSTFASAVVCLIYALVMFYRPSLVRTRMWTISCVLIYLASVGATQLVIMTVNPAWGVVAALLEQVAKVWFSFLVIMAFVVLATHWSRALEPSVHLVVFAALALAFCLSWLMKAAIISAEQTTIFATGGFKQLISLILVVLTALCALWGSRALIDESVRIPAPSELAVTNPLSYLPAWHYVFVMIVLYRAASGFGLTFVNDHGVPKTPLVAGVVLAVICALMLVMAWVRIKQREIQSRWDVLLYWLLQLAFLLVLTGFLLAPFSLGGASAYPLSHIALASGSDLFYILAYLVVVMLARQNIAAAVITAFFTLLALRLGTVFGAMLGHLANAPATLEGLFVMGLFDPARMEHDQMIALLMTGVVLVFIAYHVLALSRKSLGSLSLELPVLLQIDSSATDATSATLSTTSVAQASTQRPDHEEQARRFAQTCALTARETEVLLLLARGRSSSVIEERLTISRNTVKTHVRNIYAKTQVHSQQELIDAIDEFASNSEQPR